MARARLYIRRSDDDQSGFSPEAQEREGRRWCETNGHTVVEVYIDDDLSGGKEDRAAFQRLLTDAKADLGSIVVVHKFDRLARDTEVLLRTVYKDLLPKRVRVFSVLEAIDPYTPLGKAMLTVSGSFSTYYIDNLATEVSKGYREKFERGGWIGLLPLGYVSQFDRDANGERIKGTGRAIFSSDIDTVRAIFSLYATGNYSDLTLAEEMNRRGLTTIHKGKRVPFQKDTIRGILTNRFYLGFVTYKGEERQGTHPPAIDTGLWDQCQAIRTRRAAPPGEKGTRCGRVPVRGVGGLLSELAFCGRCGAKFHTQISSEGNSRQRYYRCGQRRRYGREACDAEMLAARQIEPVVFDVLRVLTLPPALRDAVIEVVQQRLASQTCEGGGDARTVRQQLNRLRDLYEFGHFGKAEYLQRRATLERQLPRPGAQREPGLDVEKAMQLLSDMPKLLDAVTPSQQRALLQQVVSAVWLEKYAVVAIRPTANYVLIVEAMGKVVAATSAGLEPTTFSSGG
jgi:site-specific DNA recombinase